MLMVERADQITREIDNLVDFIVIRFYRSDMRVFAVAYYVVSDSQYRRFIGHRNRMIFLQTQKSSSKTNFMIVRDYLPAI